MILGIVNMMELRYLIIKGDIDMTNTENRLKDMIVSGASNDDILKSFGVLHLHCRMM